MILDDDVYFLEEDEEYLMHIGMPRRSGRYPWGSGDDPYQRSQDFFARYKSFGNRGLSERDIATAMGYDSTTALRIAKSRAGNDVKVYRQNTIRAMRQDGLSDGEIAKKLGISVGTIKYMDKEVVQARTSAAKATADFLRKQVEEKGMIDVGKGVESELNISREKMKQALDILQEEGYNVYGGRVPQATNKGRMTTLSVLTTPDKEHKDIYNYDNIQSITEYKCRQDENGNDIIEKGFVYPASMDSKRLAIRYAEDGGVEKDGVIELRRGVKDISLGERNYAQVRILVDNDRYLKGMAVYSDDLPDGVDVLFNTNKTKDKGMRDVLKAIDTKDPNNPFGSLIKEKGGQSYYTDDNGERKLSLINKRADEGDWEQWKDQLSAQFLSKQPIELIKRQLGIKLDDVKAEFEELKSLENPTVKKEMLSKFAMECDSNAVHLNAAALPGQRYQVILPLTSISEKEIYAPNFNDGDTVALVRYPHGGTFEIPILKVNNKQAEGQKVIGKSAADAVGISSQTAERLSGADFDGDTVMVIPCNSSRSDIRIESTPRLKGLEGFDPKMAYPYKEGIKLISKQSQVTREMGMVSNLITDMTIKGASEGELARAVRHSMVVIDAKKHKLDFKASEVENNIKELRDKYQGYFDEEGNKRGGASTLISRASGEASIRKTIGTPKIDPETGNLIFKDDPTTWVDAKGKEKYRLQKTTQMMATQDANTLSSGHPKEQAYAEYANAMKQLARDARLEILATGNLKYEPKAAKEFAEEVASLKAQLNMVDKNKPRERKAQLATENYVKNAIAAMTDEPSAADIKKMSQMALTSFRKKYGAKRSTITLTDRQWEAIQKGAISENTLQRIIRAADIDSLRSRATPRTSKTLSPGKVTRLRNLVDNNYTNFQIAQALGVSVSTVIKYKEGGVE